VRNQELNPGGLIMMGIMVETVIMAFVVGGVVGAITAMQLSKAEEKIPVKINNDTSSRRRRIR